MFFWTCLSFADALNRKLAAASPAFLGFRCAIRSFIHLLRVLLYTFFLCLFLDFCFLFLPFGIFCCVPLLQLLCDFCLFVPLLLFFNPLFQYFFVHLPQFCFFFVPLLLFFIPLFQLCFFFFMFLCLRCYFQVFASLLLYSFISEFFFFRSFVSGVLLNVASFSAFVISSSASVVIVFGRSFLSLKLCLFLLPSLYCQLMH